MELIDYEGITIAVIQEDQIVIRETQDALDLMADARYQGSDCLILHEKNLHPDFFDLKTRLAGEILQKFSNYRMRMAIVGDYTNLTSKSLRDFIFESNKMGRICFVGTIEEAKSRLSKQ